MFITFILISFTIILGPLKVTLCDQSGVTFSFKEYQYKDSPKNEMTFREFESACEQSSSCNQLTGLPRTRCVRECVSPSCYRELYSPDARQRSNGHQMRSDHRCKCTSAIPATSQACCLHLGKEDYFLDSWKKVKLTCD